jgi:predicted Zn finger-like uncharacterized protein
MKPLKAPTSTKTVFAHLQCPSCDADIRSDDINIDRALAKCSSCHAVFSIEEGLPVSARRKPEVLLPNEMEVLKLRSELEILVKWRKTSSIGFLMFFTIFWNAILLPFAIGAIMSGEFGLLLGLSAHLTVGICLAYFVLTSLINTSYITVNEYRLHIEHKPLPLPFYPDRDIPIQDIDQVFIEKYVASKTNGRPNYAYAVVVELKDRKRVKVIKGLHHPNQALYIEQEIEAFLEIPDRAVDDEWKG